MRFVGGWICIAPESRIAQKISRGARRARRARREEWIRRQAADELRALCALCRITPSRPSCSSVVNLLLRSGRKSFPANPHESHSTRVLLHRVICVVALVSSAMRADSREKIAGPDARPSRPFIDQLRTQAPWSDLLSASSASTSARSLVRPVAFLLQMRSSSDGI